MSDKLKAGVLVSTTFIDGENVQANKLNSITAQVKNATRALEKAVGDIHSDSYPYSSANTNKLSAIWGSNQGGPLADAPQRDLDIANIGRLIGPASNLNPSEIGDGWITETVPTGKHQFCLNYVPDGVADIEFSDTVTFVDRVAMNLLSSSGEYYVTQYGEVFCVTESAGGTVTYPVDFNNQYGGSSYTNSSFNVIPDINQLENGDGCTVSAIDGDGRHSVTLPEVTHYHMSIDEEVVLTAQDALFEKQLELPLVLKEVYVAGEQIPEGFLFLKNHTKNIVYKSASYYYVSETEIETSGIDLTDDIADTFCIITIGTDITTSLADLKMKSRHKHDRKYGEPMIPVESITGIMAAEGEQGLFIPSENESNFAPQYLHRDGYINSVDVGLNDANVMRGDLGIGRLDGQPGTFATGSAGSTGSFALRFFGGKATASTSQGYIQKDSSGNLEISAGEVSGTLEHIEALNPIVTYEGLRTNDSTIFPGITDWSVKFFPVALTNQTQAGTYTTDLLATCGLDADCYLLGLSVMVKKTSADAWHAPSAWPSYDYEVLVNDRAHATLPWRLQLNLTGATWASDNIDIRILVTYAKP